MQEHDRAIATLWDSNADQWTIAVRGGGDVYRDEVINAAFYRRLPEISGKAVVDLGCGEGRGARALAALGGKVIAIDISEKMVSKAREFPSEKEFFIDYRVESMETLLSIPDSTVDVVTSMMAFMNVNDIDRVLSAAFRVLKPRGTLAYCVLHPAFGARGAKWIRSATDEIIGYEPGDYTSEKPYVAEWQQRASPAPLLDLRFPRTISTYINSTINAGFRIDKIDEPVLPRRISLESAENRPRLARIPLSMTVIGTRETMLPGGP